MSRPIAHDSLPKSTICFTKMSGIDTSLDPLTTRIFFLLFITALFDIHHSVFDHRRRIDNTHHGICPLKYRILHLLTQPKERTWDLIANRLQHQFSDMKSSLYRLDVSIEELKIKLENGVADASQSAIALGNCLSELKVCHIWRHFKHSMTLDFSRTLWATRTKIY
jgi:hypothetical protein